MKLLVIGGATATGKTALAVECAKRLDGEVISCDSLLVYRRLNIGTAKPMKEEMAGIPHHMIDVCEPDRNFSVSDFERMALPVLNGILARGKTPILCGGTAFYMNALLYSSSFGSTPADPALREKYKTIAEEKGKEYLHALLRERDEESAERLHPNDVKRVIRALEIVELTGRKKSEQADGTSPRFPFSAYAFDLPRDVLYERINRRVELMFERGLVEEVRGLLSGGVRKDAQCMQGIGYKEVVENLKSGASHSTMCGIIQQNTRNYAKRQLTFFKKMKNLTFIKPQSICTAAEEICADYER